MRLRHICLLLIAAIGLASCGGDGDESADPTVDPTEIEVDATATATAPTPTPLPEPTPTVGVRLADTAFTNQSKVTTAGIDELIFGMEALGAAEAASTAWIGVPESATWPQCFVVVPGNGPEGISFWVWDRTVERLDITQPALRTRSGYGVGTKLTQLQTDLGSLITVTTADDGSQFATFTPSDPSDLYRLIFEVENGEVVRYRSGRTGIVELGPEACGALPEAQLDIALSSSCPTGGISSGVAADGPVAVQTTALAVQGAALNCDLVALETLGGPDFKASFGLGSFTEVYDGRGDAIRELAVMLTFPGTQVGDEWVWPQAAQRPWADVTEPMLDELRLLGYDETDFAAFGQVGGYIGYRTAIAPDGTWRYFLAGD